MSFLQTGQEGKVQAFGELKADRIDLAALAQIADRLPIGTATHSLIRSLAPRAWSAAASQHGKVMSVRPAAMRPRAECKSLVWRRSMRPLSDWLQTSLVRKLLALAQQTRPGVRGATVDFKLNQSGGDAKLTITKGRWICPVHLKTLWCLLDTLSADAKWATMAKNG